MLKWLEIQNFALIERLDLEFDPGFNLITGETGAGKSILVDSLGFALGGRAGAECVRTGAEFCRVTAAFAISSLLEERLSEWFREKGLPLEGDELLLKRETSSAGRGRAWINGESAPLSTLASLGDLLVDFHGQHEHQSLLKVAAHLEMLDRFASLGAVREGVARQHKQLEELDAKRKFLTLNEQERVRQLDLLAFQIKELESSKIKPGEAKDLENESRLLASAEKRSLSANALKVALQGQDDGPGALASLSLAGKFLKELASLDEGLEDLSDRFQQASLEMEEISRQAGQYTDAIVFDPRRLEEVEARLDSLQKLKKKYGPTEEAMMAFLEGAKAKISNLESATEQLAEIETRWERGLVEFGKSALELSAKRREASKRFSEAVEAELKPLGMEKASLDAKISQKAQEGGWVKDASTGIAYAASQKGIDQVEFQLAANPGEEARPLAKIASGGELSRVMLALKTVLSSLDPVETLVFDEVDSGVSGRVALVVGEKLKALSGLRQVLCITHLPQVACQPGRHLKVSKEVEDGRTRVHVQSLGPLERVEEIAGLIGGNEVGESARAHARELLDQARGKEGPR
jgi:DNA repair protein RecN (Recombination protein N)